MPSSQTITAFYTFSAGDRAKAREVTNNFDTFRGHLIPVDPTASSAAPTKTYDIGSSDHRWNIGYAQALDISITTTATMLMQGLSAGGIAFKKNGTTLFSITDDGFSGANATPCGGTSAASLGNVAISSLINVTITTLTPWDGASCTVVTNGRPVCVALEVMPNTSPGCIELFRLSTTVLGLGTITTKYLSLHLVRNGITLPGYFFSFERGNYYHESLKHPPGMFFVIDTPVAGTQTYSLRGTVSWTYMAAHIKNVRLKAYEF